MAQPSLHLVDTSTGEIAPATQSVLQERIESLEQDLAAAERELRHKRAEIRRLKTKEARERQEYDQAHVVHGLFVVWQLWTGHTRSLLTPERFDRLRWALEEGYTPQQISLAIAGAAYDPFITKNKNGREQRHDDLTVILRDGHHLELYANKAPR